MQIARGRSFVITLIDLLIIADRLRCSASIRLAHDQALRLPRTAHVRSLAASNKMRFHLPDGPEQVARDAGMAAGGTAWSFKAMEWVYGHDPAAAVETGSLGLPPA